MGLLSKEVEVKLTSKNIKHYEDLGYYIPRYFNKSNYNWSVKRGTSITVKITDVPVYSHINVILKCDCCGKIYFSLYSNYSKRNHDGKIYCSDCARTVLNSGKNCHCWKDTITIEEREIGRDYLEYTNFIKRVLARDNYTCQCCGRNEGRMEVHHLDGYDWCKERRTEDLNGLVLCPTCHKSFHSIYGYGGNTKQQFEEWIGYTIKLLEEYQGILPTTRKIYCFEDNKIFDSAEQASKENGIKAGQIRKCCNMDGYKNGKKHSVKSANGKHYFWLDEFNKMSQENLDDYFKWANSVKYNYLSGKDNLGSKSVICITTGKFFDTLTQAAKYYNICSASLITRCCKGRTKHCGKLEDGTKLQWEYCDDSSDYLKSTTSFSEVSV